MKCNENDIKAALRTARLYYRSNMIESIPKIIKVCIHDMEFGREREIERAVEFLQVKGGVAGLIFAKIRHHYCTRPALNPRIITEDSPELTKVVQYYQKIKISKLVDFKTKQNFYERCINVFNYITHNFELEKSIVNFVMSFNHNFTAVNLLNAFYSSYAYYDTYSEVSYEEARFAELKVVSSCMVEVVVNYGPFNVDVEPETTPVFEITNKAGTKLECPREFEIVEKDADF